MQAQDGDLGKLRWVFLEALMSIKPSFMPPPPTKSTPLSPAHTLRLGADFVYNLEYAQ